MQLNKLSKSLVGMALIVSAVTVYAAQSTSLTSTQKDYLKQVYPLANPAKFSADFFNSLDFYWYNKKATGQFFKSVNFTPKAGSQSEFICLGWMIPCKPGKNGGTVRNPYMQKLIGQNHINAIPSHGYAEVYHAAYYHEPGFYYYVMKGTGVFLNVGNTLIARNKVDALHKMGLSYQDILKLGGLFSVKGQPVSTYQTIKTLADKKGVSFPKMVDRFYKHVISGDQYNADRVGNSMAYDYALYSLARQKGYDTVQMTVQPNDNGAWGYEMVDVRPNVAKTLKHNWLQERKLLTTRDPFNMKHYAPCEFPVPFDIVRCGKIKSDAPDHG